MTPTIAILRGGLAFFAAFLVQSTVALTLSGAASGWGWRFDMTVLVAFGFEIGAASLVAVFAMWGLFARRRVRVHWLCSPLIFLSTFFVLGWFRERFDFSTEWPALAIAVTVIFVSGTVAWMAAFGGSKYVDLTNSSSASRKD